MKWRGYFMEIENEYKYKIEKIIFSKEITDKLFMVFGRAIGGSIRNVYIAIKILHQKYTDGNYNKFFYCSNKQIGDLAFLSSKQAGLYVRVLKKLGLIFRLINPKQSTINENDNLEELAMKFYSHSYKKKTFIKVSIPTKEVLKEAILRIGEVKKWLDQHNKISTDLKRTKRILKRLESTMSKDEIDQAKNKRIQA